MKNKLSQILEIVFKMSTIQRYSQTHLNRPESVLEHSGFVCLLAYYIGNKLKAEGYSIDFGILLSKAITHDMDEIITGDIPRPTKYYNEGVTKALRTIEVDNMSLIARNLDIPEIFDNWNQAKSGGIEGNIIALCDAIAVVYKVWYEVVMLGNKTIADHVTDAYKGLDKIYVKFVDNFGASSTLQSITQEAILLAQQTIKTGENK